MIQANALLDSNIANHIKAQEEQLRNRQKAYFRKALTAKYSRPASLEQSRNFQSHRQDSIRGVELSSPIKSAETQIRIWIGLPERGVTPERRQQFKRNMAIGFLASFTLLGILLTPVSQQAPLTSMTFQCQPSSSKTEVSAKAPVQKENTVADAIGSDLNMSKSLEQDTDMEPFDESQAVMQEW